MPSKGMSDYSSLAQRVSMSVPGVRGCLLLSRDGLVLGAHPEGEEEQHVKEAWVRFAAIGEPDRSYLEYPDQVWAFVRRGGYAAFAVAEAGVRPGVLVDLLDQALMTGEQERSRDRETLRLPEAPRHRRASRGRTSTRRTGRRNPNPSRSWRSRPPSKRSKRPSRRSREPPTRSRPRHSMPRRRESSSARRRPPTRTVRGARPSGCRGRRQGQARREEARSRRGERGDRGRPDPASQRVRRAASGPHGG